MGWPLRSRGREMAAGSERWEWVPEPQSEKKNHTYRHSRIHLTRVGTTVGKMEIGIGAGVGEMG